MSLFFRFVGIFVKTDNKCILFSGHGKRYNDSPKAIYLYLVMHGLDKEYRCIWSVDDESKYLIEGRHEIVIIDTWRYFVTALKSKYWCCCVNIERGLKFKKKKTIFLNTWHCVPTNYMGNAVNGRKDFDWRKTNYICCSGEFEIPIIIRDCMAYEKNIIKTGLPRNDELWHVNSISQNVIKSKLKIDKTKKVILYAPTWRDSEDLGKDYVLKPPIDWDYWKEKIGDEYVVLLRTHAYTTKLMGVKFDEFVRDCSSYPEVNDLMIAADILISDYSSIIFDYAILERPIICFGYDFEEYSKKRGFYFDLNKEFPSGVIQNEEELLNYIISMNYDDECKKTKRMKNKFVLYGGNAAEECSKLLLNI